MTLRLSHDPPAGWRPARFDDLAAIVALAGRVHPSYPERPAVFANRLDLHPTGMMLALLDGQPVGYAIGHPWRGAAPVLDRVLDALPDAPDSYWLHDLALSPEARGRGLGGAALRVLRADAARCGLDRMRLAAVGDAAGFWRTNGFAPTPDRLPACYGTGAVSMQRIG